MGRWDRMGRRPLGSSRKVRTGFPAVGDSIKPGTVVRVQIGAE